MEKLREQLNPEKPMEAENPYWGLRQQALHCQPEQLGGHAQMESTVYAAVVDMNLGSGLWASLACFMDGTASLYCSNGGGLLGAGQQYQAVNQAAVDFLHSAQQVLDLMASAADFALPEVGAHTLYLISTKGIFKQTYHQEKLADCSRPMQFLNFLYQNVLKTISQSLDAAQKGEGSAKVAPIGQVGSIQQTKPTE